MTISLSSIKHYLSVKFIKYILIGLSANILAYAAYFILTQQDIQPKTAMTIVYISSVLFSFLPQKRIAFQNSSNFGQAFMAYLLCHLLGFLLNLFFLYYFVDLLGYSHYWIQLFSIISVAIFLFIAFNFFAFKNVSN